MEAGMILGLTAAGISETNAVAATFVQRTFTSYLPPLWGWFVLVWMRRAGVSVGSRRHECRGNRGARRAPNEHRWRLAVAQNPKLSVTSREHEDEILEIVDARITAPSRRALPFRHLVVRLARYDQRVSHRGCLLPATPQRSCRIVVHPFHLADA